MAGGHKKISELRHGAGNAYHVVTMVNPGNYTANRGQIQVNTVFDGFTVTGGKADGATPHDAGGGVLITGTTSRQAHIENCRITGNAADNGGGIAMTATIGLKIYAEQAPGAFSSVALAGNRAGTQGGALYGEQVASGDPTAFRSVLIWGNGDHGGSGTPGASIAGAILGNATYQTCLIEGYAPGGDNLDGTLAANDPAFVAPVPVANAPTVAGDYHLTFGSPAIDRASSSAGEFDLLGVPRDSNPDIGAYEYVSPYTDWIAGFFPGETDPAIVDPDADPDADGCPNAKEFAHDGDPSSGNDDAKERSGFVDVAGTIHLSLTLPVRSRAVFVGTPSPTATVDGISYTIGGSENLQDWTLPVAEVAPADSDGLPALNAGWEYRTFIVGDGTLPRAFVRAVITSAL